MIPRAYGVAIVLCTLAAGGVAMYERGKDAGIRHEQRATLAVETPKAEHAVAEARAKSDTVVTVATKARHVSDSTRGQRVAVRQAALAELLDSGLPKIHALVALDDTLLQRDSVTIAVQAGAIATLLAERAPRERLDSLRVATIHLGAAPDHHTTAKIVGGLLVGILGTLALIHFAR